MVKVDFSEGGAARGPVKNRSCTDVLCLLIFVAFLAGWGIVGYFGFLLGDPQRLLHPTDSEGRVCGLDENLVLKPYLFFFDLTKCANPTVLTHGCPTPQVCVSSCPTESFVATEWALLDEAGTKQKLICKENATMHRSSVKELVQRGDCASWYIQSTPVAGRCIPMLPNISAIEDVVFNKTPIPVTVQDLVNGTAILAELLNARQMVEGILQDFNNSWWIILIGLAVSMIVSFLWIVLMRFIAGFMVWMSIIAVVAMQGLGCWYCFDRYQKLEHVDGASRSLTEIALTTNLASYLALRETWLVFLIGAAVITAVTLLALIFLRNRIRIAIALIGQGSKAVGQIMSTLLFPIIPWILQVAVIGYFLAVGVYLASASEASFKVVGSNYSLSNCNCSGFVLSDGFCNPIGFKEWCKWSCPDVKCQFFEYGGNPHIFRLQIYNIFGLFWGLFFVSAMAEMVLAGAFASWYWAFKKPHDVPAFALSNSFYRTVRYHLGTIAFGSLIISFIRSIRVLLEYIDRKVREYQDNCCSKMLLCCCKCCFWMLEKFMRYINRNAYVVCAIYGKNFCSSARDAFFLLLRNVVRVAVLDNVTDFLLFIGRLVIVGSMGIASYYVFNGRFEYFNENLPQLNYNLVPVITTMLGAFFISSVFFSVYSMAIDTIFLCFLQDSEENDGSPGKPYYMSKDLMSILGKKNKI